MRNLRNLDSLNFEYYSSYVIVGEDLQKLRLAKKMMMEYDITAITNIIMLEPMIISDIDNHIEIYERFYENITNREKKDEIEYGINYTNKIVVRRMIANNKSNAEILKYVNVEQRYIEQIRLQEFYYIDYDYPHDLIITGKGRWETIEEEKDYNHANYFDGIRAIGSIAHLKYISRDGIERIISKSPYFYDTRVYFTKYIITEELYNELIHNEETAKASYEKQNLIKQIKNLKNIISEYKKHPLYYAKDVPKLKKQYNDIFNEGGEGYIPTYYTYEQLAFFEKKLLELIASTKERSWS